MNTHREYYRARVLRQSGVFAVDTRAKQVVIMSDDLLENSQMAPYIEPKCIRALKHLSSQGWNIQTTMSL